MKAMMIYGIIINIIGFCIMGIDKKRARANEWRIPEKTLFGVALVGGSIGAYTGMYFFHHKTKHWYFVLGIPCIALIQMFLLWKFFG